MPPSDRETTPARENPRPKVAVASALYVTAYLLLAGAEFAAASYGITHAGARALGPGGAADRPVGQQVAFQGVLLAVCAAMFAAGYRGLPLAAARRPAIGVWETMTAVRADPGLRAYQYFHGGLLLLAGRALVALNNLSAALWQISLPRLVRRGMAAVGVGQLEGDALLLASVCVLAVVAFAVVTPLTHRALRSGQQQGAAA
jgi:hypothetical protein